MRSDTKIIYGVNPEFGVADGAGRSPCIPTKVKRQINSLRFETSDSESSPNQAANSLSRRLESGQPAGQLHMKSRVVRLARIGGRQERYLRLQPPSPSSLVLWYQCPFGHQIGPLKLQGEKRSGDLEEREEERDRTQEESSGPSEGGGRA